MILAAPSDTELTMDRDVGKQPNHPSLMSADQLLLARAMAFSQAQQGSFPVSANVTEQRRGSRDEIAMLPEEFAPGPNVCFCLHRL